MQTHNHNVTTTGSTKQHSSRNETHTHTQTDCGSYRADHAFPFYQWSIPNSGNPLRHLTVLFRPLSTTTYPPRQPRDTPSDNVDAPGNAVLRFTHSFSTVTGPSLREDLLITLVSLSLLPVPLSRLNDLPFQSLVASSISRFVSVCYLCWLGRRRVCLCMCVCVCVVNDI